MRPPRGAPILSTSRRPRHPGSWWSRLLLVPLLVTAPLLLPLLTVAGLTASSRLCGWAASGFRSTRLRHFTGPSCPEATPFAEATTIRRSSWLRGRGSLRVVVPVHQMPASAGKPSPSLTCRRSLRLELLSIRPRVSPRRIAPQSSFDAWPTRAADRPELEVECTRSGWVQLRDTRWGGVLLETDLGHVRALRLSPSGERLEVIRRDRSGSRPLETLVVDLRPVVNSRPAF